MPHRHHALSRALILFVTAVAALLLMLASGSAAGSGAPDTTRLVVESGDTLWSIAVGMTSPQDDVRATIHHIRQLNALTRSDLAIGQVLVVPVAPG